MIPIISLNNSSPASDIAQALCEACTTVGFFYLTEHGVSQQLMDDVLRSSKQLFCLPLDQKVELADPILQRGYTRFEEETLDPMNQPKRGYTKEGYYIGAEVAREEMDTKKLKGPNVWPKSSSCQWEDDKCMMFRRTMEQYRSEAKQLCTKLLSYFALAVGSTNAQLFDEYFTDPTTLIRLLHYSGEPSDPTDGVYACGAHSDYGMLTLLMTDDNPGLQVKVGADEQWVNVPPMKGAFVVNIGDMFERWTNGLFRSTIHRVIQPKNCKERYSVPFFFEPNFDALVKCLDECCSEQHPAKYEPITAGQHLLNMYGMTHADFDQMKEVS
jgi:isopenicillin N synthase-like dioxygenase